MNTKIGKRLLVLRKNKNMSQAELSVLSGVSQTYISDLEKEKKTPTLNTIAKLAAGLNCSIYDLIEVETEKAGKGRQNGSTANITVNI